MHKKRLIKFINLKIYKNSNVFLLSRPSIIHVLSDLSFPLSKLFELGYIINICYP